MQELGLAIIVFLATLTGTGLIRRYALATNLLDIPNHRSSHAIPTPRGGGIAIVLVYICVLGVLFWLNQLPASAFIALAGAGACIALIGFIDDHRHVPASLRLIVHFLCVGWGLFWLGGLPALPFVGRAFDLGFFGHAVALVYGVWLLNLFNFMDGIDGLAGVETITVCIGGSLLFFLDGNLAWTEPALLAAATSGFLVWNFPPAKIFLGDAGSGFLGVILALLSIQAAGFKSELFWSWNCLMGVFIVDATWTLWRRFRRGEALHQAHRSHAYQKAARRFGSHKAVTLTVGAINIFWLLPWSFAIGLGTVNGPLGISAAYLPIILTAVWLKAGDMDSQP